MVATFRLSYMKDERVTGLLCLRALHIVIVSVIHHSRMAILLEHIIDRSYQILEWDTSSGY